MTISHMSFHKCVRLTLSIDTGNYNPSTRYIRCIVRMYRHRVMRTSDILNSRDRDPSCNTKERRARNPESRWNPPYVSRTIMHQLNELIKNMLTLCGLLGAFRRIMTILQSLSHYICFESSSKMRCPVMFRRRGSHIGQYRPPDRGFFDSTYRGDIHLRHLLRPCRYQHMSDQQCATVPNFLYPTATISGLSLLLSLVYYNYCYVCLI
jgi:hypothetical protein